MYKIVSVLALVGFLFMACSSKTTIRPGDSLEVAFEKAVLVYEQENYSQAARNFEVVLSIGRGTAIARDAQFLLAESYFKNRNYMMAAAEYRRYYTNNPRSERRQEAEFKEALSYFELSPRYKLDQRDTYRAMELFQIFIQRYPNTERASDANKYIEQMRSKLAQKTFEAAELYLRIRQYNSAAIYYDQTLEKYPETVWAEKALMRQILAYTLYAENSVLNRQEERFEMAVKSYERYLQIFPRGENRHLAEKHYNRAMDGLSEVRNLSQAQ